MTPPRSLPALLLVALLFLSAPVRAADELFFPKLPFNSAMVSYEISGTESGTETLHLADYGRKRARLRNTTTKFMSVTSKVHTLELVDPEWRTMIDLTAKSGTRTINPAKLIKEEYDKLSAAEQKIVRRNMEKLGTNVGGGARIRYKAAKHLGYTCDEVTVAGVTSLVLSGSDVAARVEVKAGGMQSRTVATRIDTKAAVTAQHFAVPAGITVKRDPAQDAQARQSAKAVIDFLKDPAAEKKMAAGMNQAEQARKAAEQAAREQGGGAAAEAIRKQMELLKGLSR